MTAPVPLADLMRDADSGNAWAQSELGHRYFDGRDGVARDVEKAVLWLRRAAEQNQVDAQFKLGFLTLDGQGVPKDIDAASRWFRLAADQGNSSGMWGLGLVHEMKREDAEAARWYRRSAGLGDPSAQFALALNYEFGDGLPMDPAEALAWYRIAAQGFSRSLRDDLNGAKSRGEQLSAKLSPDDLARSAARQAALDRTILRPDGDNALPDDADAVAFRTDHFEDQRSKTLIVVTTKLKLDVGDPAYDAARVGFLNDWATRLVEQTPGAHGYSIVEVTDDP